MTERKLSAPGNNLVTGRAFNLISLQRNVRALRSWWSRERKDRVCYNSLPNDVLDSIVIDSEFGDLFAKAVIQY